MMKKKLIHPVESGTEVRRFPSFPRTEKGRECGNERERNSIAGGDDRRRIVVHENIARLTVNDFAWSSGLLVVDDFNRRPSTGKKAHRPERNSERRKRTDFPIFRYGSRSTESSRGKYDVLYELNVACRAHVV